MDVSSGPLSEVVSTGPLPEVVSTGPLSEVASAGPLSEVASPGPLSEVVSPGPLVGPNGGARSAVGFHGNEKSMAVPLGAGVQGDGWHCLDFLRG